MAERGVTKVPLCFLSRSLEKCFIVMPFISVKDGILPGVVLSRRQQQKHMDWK